jgi:hypothetical protein
MKEKVYKFIILVLLVAIMFMNFSPDISLSKPSSKESFVDKLIKIIKPEDRERKYVFIDLGANKGDSIYNFFGLSEKSHAGDKLSSLVSLNIVKNNKWDVYGFEGNPIFDEPLAAMKSDVEKRNKNVNIHIYNRTIAWTYDGMIDFHLDIVNTNENSVGRFFFNDQSLIKNINSNELN